MKHGFLTLLLLLLVLVGSASAKEITLAWDPSPTPEVTGYEVCYTNINGILVGGQGVPTAGNLPECFSVGNVLTWTSVGGPYTFADDVAYYFSVLAYNAVEQKSALSNVVMSPGFNIPEPPQNMTMITTVNGIDVP